MNKHERPAKVTKLRALVVSEFRESFEYFAAEEGAAAALEFLNCVYSESTMDDATYDSFKGALGVF